MSGFYLDWKARGAIEVEVGGAIGCAVLLLRRGEA